MSQDTEESLLADKLSNGDQSSIIVAGMVVAESLKSVGVCVLAEDALGRVVLCPPSSDWKLYVPKVSNSDLDLLPEDKAIEVMVKEGRDEESIISYLSRRP